ncbi:hypothetical protein HDU92_003955 [Lobulomyces angularis]|nr:hypothetical protein HDU92_003955 [Lobulomyces angularis]
MTTAARPTWLPAVGGFSLRDSNNAPQHMFSSLDLPAHKVLKKRKVGQNSKVDIKNKEEMIEKLKQAELEYFNKSKKSKKGVNLSEEAELKLKELEKNIDADDTDDESSEEEDEVATGENNGKKEVDLKGKKNMRDSDEEEEAKTKESDKSSDEDSSDEEEEDDTADLLRELEKIKKERAEEKERLERLKLAEEQELLSQQAETGNPLLNVSNEFNVKRRWDDDVIFKNQSKGLSDKPQKRFINDLLRSDFHRKFMAKFLK